MDDNWLEKIVNSEDVFNNIIVKEVHYDHVFDGNPEQNKKYCDNSQDMITSYVHQGVRYRFFLHRWKQVVDIRNFIDSKCIVMSLVKCVVLKPKLLSMARYYLCLLDLYLKGNTRTKKKIRKKIKK